MKYSELVDWLFKLSEQSTFKSETHSFLEIRKPYAIKIDWERGIATFEEHVHPKSPELHQFSESFDEYIFKTSSRIWVKTATLIQEEFPDRDQKRIIDGWIKKLKIAQKLIETNKFYLQFPSYAKSIQKTIDRLNEFKLRVHDSTKKRGNPNWKGLNYQEEAEIIRHANNLLKTDPKEYKPRRGAYVSERLKIKVTEGLTESIPNLSKHKVARVLREHHALLES